MDLFIYIVLIACGILISILVMRAIFSIDTIVKQLKAQTKLAALAAKAVGASEAEINNIIMDSKK